MANQCICLCVSPLLVPPYAILLIAVPGADSPNVPLPQGYAFGDSGGAVSNDGDLEFMGNTVVTGTTEVISRKVLCLVP